MNRSFATVLVSIAVVACGRSGRDERVVASGHIEGAVNLSVHELDRRLGEVPSNRHQEIVAICRSGKRSGWATMFLRVAGWKRVRSVSGGMLDWEKEGLSVRKG